MLYNNASHLRTSFLVLVICKIVALSHCVCKFPQACDERRVVELSESTSRSRSKVKGRGQSSSSQSSQSSGGAELGFFEAMSSTEEDSIKFRPVDPVAEQLASDLVSRP